MGADTSVEERRYRELQRRADRISSLIVASDYPAIDLAIEIRALRGFAAEHFPGSGRLFRMVYEGRFLRLWEQFRGEEAGGLPL